MLTDYFKKRSWIARLRATAVGERLDGFCEWLGLRGYRPSRIRALATGAGHFSLWATQKKLVEAELQSAALEGFRRHLRRCSCRGYSGGRSRDRTLCGARRLVEYLTELERVTPPEWRLQQDPPLLTSFCDWMAQNRGTKRVTLDGYARFIRELLLSVGDDPVRYQVHTLRSFVLKCSRRHGPRVFTALRMFLRYLASSGRCRPELLAAIPSARTPRVKKLPGYLQDEEVEKLLAACDRALRPRRDRAILLLLCRLGLRAGDIVRLCLSDIDWTLAQIRVSGKTPQQTLLPLTQEVGDALVDYIDKERPAATDEHVFLTAVAPVKPLGSSTTVPAIARAALLRAGIQAPSLGAHLLRHTAATAMLREGAALEDIAAVLRHKSVNVTAYYSKVDFDALRLVVQPWPEVPPC